MGRFDPKVTREGRFNPTISKPVVRAPSSRFNPNRNLATTGQDRIAGRTTTSAPVTVNTSNPSRAGVMALQRQLNAQGANLVVDGIMGPATRAAQSGAPSRSTSSGSSPGGGGGGGSFSSGGSFNFGNAGAVDRSVQSTQARGDLASLRAERLQAALAAIGAQFDFEEGGLNSQISQLGALFNTTERQNQRTGERNIEGIGNAAVERGLFRSGINAQATSEEFGRQAEEQGALEAQINPEEGNEGLQIRALMSAIALLGQQQAGAEGQAKLDAEKDELDIAQLVALVGAGLQ